MIYPHGYVTFHSLPLPSIAFHYITFRYIQYNVYIQYTVHHSIRILTSKDRTIFSHKNRYERACVKSWATSKYTLCDPQVFHFDPYQFD